ERLLDGGGFATTDTDQDGLAAGFLHRREQFLRQRDERTAFVSVLEAAREFRRRFGAGRRGEESGADQQILALAGGGETAHQAGQDVLSDDRQFPDRMRSWRQQGEHGVAIGAALVLNGPPEQQRLARVGGIGVAREQIAND